MPIRPRPLACSLLLGAGLLAVFPSPAADRVREQDIVDQVTATVRVGDPVWLDAAGGRFLALFTPAGRPRVRGGVILLHDRGGNPNRLDVIRPLRIGLAARRWDTLALQMPVAAWDAPDQAWSELVPEAAPRIRSGIDFLRARGVDGLVLIGQGLGARMAAAFMATEPTPEIGALVLIGLPAAQADAVAERLRSVPVPVLEITGGPEGPVPGAAESARQGRRFPWRRVVLEGVAPRFQGDDARLLALISGWLARYGSGRKADGGEAVAAVGATTGD